MRFKVTGVDKDTGQPATAVIDAESRDAAKREALSIGMMVDDVRAVKGSTRAAPAPATTIENGRETTVWKSNPTQWVNLWVFIVCGLLFFLIVTIIIIVIRYLRIRTTNYTLTTERIIIEYGILHRRREEIELYRVKDTTVQRPLFYRLVGIGTIHVEASDRTTPWFPLCAVKEPMVVKELIRTYTEARRKMERVRELDVAGNGVMFA